MDKFKGNILILDDEKDLRALLVRMLELEEYKVYSAAKPDDAFMILEKEEVEVIISDVRLEIANGLELIPEFKRRKPFAEIIMLTAYGNITDGVHSIKSGAFEYLTKGDDNMRIVPVVEEALKTARLGSRIFKIDESPAEPGFEHIIGESQQIQDAISLARKVAPSDASVLLTGETGTGKEVFAQAIHKASKRKDKPFTAINCSAISKEILESELFGHQKGAFTGAAQDKEGFFEISNGGTLFLDEIGEMSPELQSKLLRVLETGKYYRVGSTKEMQTDVRVVAATNRDLLKESESGGFRSDLYYRLATFTIHLPPLRSRGNDIVLLAHHFAGHAAKRMGGERIEIEKDFIQEIKKNPWKGNLRELKNVMERAVILSQEGKVTSDMLPPDFHDNGGSKNSSGLNPNAVIDLQTLEKDHIKNMLEFTGGNKTRTAEILGIGIATLYRKIQEYDLSN